MPIDKSKITNDMIKRAKECKTADDLIALAKSEGFEITKEEAESFLAELENIELDSKELDKIAGGYCISEAVMDCPIDLCKLLVG